MNTQPIPTTKDGLIQAISKHHVEIATQIEELANVQNEIHMDKFKLKNLEAEINVKARATLGKPTIDAVEAVISMDENVITARRNLEISNQHLVSDKAKLEILQEQFRSMQLIASLLVSN